MKNITSRIGERLMLRAIAILLLGTSALAVFAATPASAVKVWSVGGNFEQPPGTPKNKPCLIVSGVCPDPATLSGQRYINLKVVSAKNGKPIENAMAYLVRQPQIPETVVFNTDNQGFTQIWNIEGCHRKLVVTNGVATVKQWIYLPPGNCREILVKLSAGQR